MRITNSLINIRAITCHFQPRIESWLQKEQLSTPSEEQILEVLRLHHLMISVISLLFFIFRLFFILLIQVVRANYDSLTLKLQDSLDQYDNYAENPNYTSFFTSLVRSIVSDTRQKIVLDDLDLQDVLQNFSSIS